MRAYRIEIKPTQDQAIKINKTLGVVKFIYNFYLSHNKEVYEKEKRFVTGYDFSKWLNNEFLPENSNYSWIKEVSSKAVKQSIMDADNAFRRFFNGKSKFPRFKKKNAIVKAYLPKNNKTDFTLERHRVKIPTLGWVRLKEFGYVPLNAEIKSCKVSRIADRYFVSILVPESMPSTILSKSQEGIGVDVGLKEFAILDDGRTFKNINKSNKVKKLEKKLRREQRSLSRKLLNTIKKKGGANKNIQRNKLRVQRLHMKLTNVRQEYVRFVVNSLVSKNPQFIAIENLNVRGMIKNRHLSKAIQKSNFYYFKEFLMQQSRKKGIEVRVIDRWYPSSKLCSHCGMIKSDLKLRDRVYRCDCGYTEDRDINAAINIRNCKTYQIAT